MPFVAIWNTDNVLGDEICRSLGGKNSCFKLSDQLEPENLKNNLQERNVFIFVCDFSDGQAFSSHGFIDQICLRFRKMFGLTREVCELLQEEKKKGEIVYITVDSGLKFPIGLICDDALTAYLGSLAEDFSKSTVEVKGVYVKTFSRFIEKERKNGDRAGKHTHTIYRLEDLLAYLKETALGEHDFLAEKIYYLGVGISSEVSQKSL